MLAIWLTLNAYSVQQQTKDQKQSRTCLINTKIVAGSMDKWCAESRPPNRCKKEKGGSCVVRQTNCKMSGNLYFLSLILIIIHISFFRTYLLSWSAFTTVVGQGSQNKELSG